MAESSATTPLTSDKDHNADDKCRHQMNDGKRPNIKFKPRPPPAPAPAPSSDETQETTDDDGNRDDDYVDDSNNVDDDYEDGDYVDDSNDVDDDSEDDDDGYDETINDNHNTKLELLKDRLRNLININDENDPKIILRKKITETDLDPDQGRLSMPKMQLLVDTPFVTYPEHLNLQNTKNFKISVKVIMNNTVYDMSLSRWKYHQKNINKPRGFKYVLQCGWTELLAEQILEKDDIILVMSFRVDNQLHFAIFKD